MDYTREQIVAVAGVLAILLGVIVYNNLRAMRPKAKATAPDVKDPIIGRYVHHEGAVVGQAIAVHGDRVLLKQGNIHKAVPRAQLEPVGDELRLMGTVDWMDAEKEGAALAGAKASEPNA
ncbi:MAG: DUF5749 family beta-barrel protein [bacterium]